MIEKIVRIRQLAIVAATGESGESVGGGVKAFDRKAYNSELVEA